MKLSILTPSKKLVTEIEVTEVFAPGVEGEIEILPQHANFLTELETGSIHWKQEGGALGAAAISYGWLEVFDNKISILADVGELASDINEDRAKKAEVIASKKVAEGGLSDDDYKKNELKLKRAMSRLAATRLH